MRILHWSDSFQICVAKGGSLDFINNLTRSQQKKGHQVVVIADAFAGCESLVPPDGITVNRFPFTKTAFSSDLGEIRRITELAGDVKRQFRPDIVHLHLNHTAAWFELLSKNSYQAPTVLTFHPPVNKTGFPNNLLKRIVDAADAVVCVSEAQKKNADEILGIQDKSRVIYNGIPAVAVKPSAILFNPATILCLGRLHETKGFAFALQACARVLQMMPGSIKVVVAGDGPETERLKELADNLGFKDYELEFKGWVDANDIPALINQSSMLLMPSIWSEPFGLVAAQAAQMGRPIIASNVGGIPEVVKHLKTGVLVPAGDAEAIADAIKMLLSQPGLTLEMGAAAQKHAKESFELDRCAAQYESLYAGTINSTIKI